jgi:hypothetical protein
MGPVADTRTCAQCGTLFTPRREHARFCSARCRVAWNQENVGDRQAGSSALDWSIAAMRDAVDRLATDLAPDLAHAVALVSEAVWWVTLVDATLVRYHHQAYEDIMKASAGRRSIEGTFAGLRFIRNQMGYHLDPADLIHPGQHHPGADHGPVAVWTWRSLGEPDLSSLPPRGRAWEMTRYRAYQAHLAGHTLGDTFGRAAEFLKLASGNPAAA